jgi:hypothetical protein
MNNSVDDRDDEDDDNEDAAQQSARRNSPPVFVSSCVWRISSALVVRLDDVFGDVDDAYVNGSQVWLREDGPRNTMIEWRLHPVASYEKPKGVPTIQVFPKTALAIAKGYEPAPTPELLWDGLEAFAAYDDEPLTPDELHTAVVNALGIEPDAWGSVDHDHIGDAWESAEGARSVISDLLAQLTPTTG